jgi:nucleoside-diphosphate-sugar epimerase
MTEHVLVAGATGCVGWHVSTAFRAHGATVVGVGRRPVRDAPCDQFVPLDLTRSTVAELAGLLAGKRITTVVNATLGWSSDDDEMMALCVRPVELLLATLSAMRKPPRLVQLGTVHEYGPMAHGSAAVESAPTRPVAPYPRARLASTRLVVAAVTAGTVDGVALRLANTIGPRPARSAFFGSLAARLATVDPATGIDVPIAEAQRDYLDVRDAAGAVVAAARSDTADPLVNVGSGRVYRISAMVAELIAVAGLPAGAVRVAVSEVVGQAGGAPANWLQLDNRRATRLLGWQPQYDVATSLRDMYDSVAAQPDQNAADVPAGTPK